jgi:hypothetical protein
VNDLMLASGTEISEEEEDISERAGEREEDEDRDDRDRSRAAEGAEDCQLRSKIALAARISSILKLLKYPPWKLWLKIFWQSSSM